MFTGIITAIGRIKEIEGPKVVISAPFDPKDINLGASIACDGCCLTVTHVEPEEEGSTFSVDVSNETFNCTTLGNWTPGTNINLEQSLKVGAELGGHIVTGHVDGVAEIVGIEDDGVSRRFTFEAPASLARFIAPKGSVALNGTSLTVNEVDGQRFGINLIPHTLSVTTWGQLQKSDKVNLEADLLARYVARLTEFTAGND